MKRQNICLNAVVKQISHFPGESNSSYQAVLFFSYLVVKERTKFTNIHNCKMREKKYTIDVCGSCTKVSHYEI